MKSICSQYDLKYTMNEIRVMYINKNEAEVYCVQTMETIDNSEFKDNKSTYINKMKKVNGKWKIYNSIINNVEYIN